MPAADEVACRLWERQRAGTRPAPIEGLAFADWGAERWAVLAEGYIRSYTRRLRGVRGALRGESPPAQGRAETAVQRQWSVAGGQWSVVSGRWSVVGGQWSVVSGRWSVVGGQWSVVSGRWSVASGRWSVVGGQWSVASGQWPVASGRWSGTAGAGYDTGCIRGIGIGTSVLDCVPVVHALGGSGRSAVQYCQPLDAHFDAVTKDRRP